MDEFIIGGMGLNLEARTDEGQMFSVPDKLGPQSVVEVFEDRNYFKSMHVRSPGGALFEIAWTVPEGWAKDEAPDAIGQLLVFPPWFEDQSAELRQVLEEAAF